MDFHSIWSLVLTAGVGTVGWIASSIYAAIKSLEYELANHKIEAAKTYYTRIDAMRIEDKLDRILEKLDRKMDKENH